MFELPALPQFAGRDAAEATRIRTVVLAYLNAELVETQMGLPKDSPFLPGLDQAWRECCAMDDPAWWLQWSVDTHMFTNPCRHAGIALNDARAAQGKRNRNSGWLSMDAMKRKHGFQASSYSWRHSPVEFLHLFPRVPLPDDSCACASWQRRTPPCGPFPADGGTWIYTDAFMARDDWVTVPRGFCDATFGAPSALAVSSRLLVQTAESLIAALSEEQEGSLEDLPAPPWEGNLRVLSFFAEFMRLDVPGRSTKHALLKPGRDGWRIFMRRLLDLAASNKVFCEERTADYCERLGAVRDFALEGHARMAMLPTEAPREEPWL